MPTPPTLILVPGHWHTTTHLEPLTTALSKLTPPLPSQPLQLHTVGRKRKGSPRPTFSDDVSVIYTAVTREVLAGRDVCLVLHSYAGVPGAEAVNCLVKDGVVDGVDREGNIIERVEERKDVKETGEKEGTRLGKLIRVVFIAAMSIPAKASIDPKDFVGPGNPGFSIDDQHMTHMSSPWHFFFNDLPLSAAKPFVDSCGATYYVGPMHLTSERWRQAPITALLCKKDNAMPPSRQQKSWNWLLEEEVDDAEEHGYEGEHVEEVGKKGNDEGQNGAAEKKRPKRHDLEWMEACHTPWVSRAEDVATFLARVLGR